MIYSFDKTLYPELIATYNRAIRRDADTERDELFMIGIDTRKMPLIHIDGLFHAGDGSFYMCDLLTDQSMDTAPAIIDAIDELGAEEWLKQNVDLLTESKPELSYWQHESVYD